MAETFEDIVRRALCTPAGCHAHDAVVHRIVKDVREATAPPLEPSPLTLDLTAEPFLWLQSGEEEGGCLCGCRLVRSHQGSGPAVFLCESHRAGRDVAVADKDGAILRHDALAEAAEEPRKS